MNLRNEICNILIKIPFTDKYSIQDFETDVNRIQLLFDKYYISRDQLRIMLNRLEDVPEFEYALFDSGYRTALDALRDQLK